ncbi:GGDEF domain-containing protein [Halanaerobaculum tunisiense]
MKENMFAKYPYPINLFLNQLSENIIVYFDKDYYILDYNEEFLNLFDFNKGKLKKKKISNLLTEKSFNKLKVNFGKDKSYKRKNLEFLSSLVNNKIHNTYNCYLFKLEDSFCLIGKQETYKKTEIINEISKLNNQLANKSRKLTKKNKKLNKANKRIENLLRTDELTELSNRRHFMEYFKKMIARSKRYSTSLSLIMCDLDKFKEINDNYGHDIGDKVLKAVGELLKEETREEDMAARVGGEEFSILLTDTSLQNGKVYAERIRKKVSQLDIEEVDRKITLSLGITKLKESDDKESFFKRADEALYKAKNSGRNKVSWLSK